MCSAVHGVSPLRGHDADGCEVGLNPRGTGGGRVEGSMVDQKRFALNGGVRDEIKRRYLVRGNAEVFQRGNGCFGGGHCDG